jgi:hypothetical protein
MNSTELTSTALDPTVESDSINDAVNAIDQIIVDRDGLTDPQSVPLSYSINPSMEQNESSHFIQ